MTQGQGFYFHISDTHIFSCVPIVLTGRVPHCRYSFAFCFFHLQYILEIDPYQFVEIFFIPLKNFFKNQGKIYIKFTILTIFFFFSVPRSILVR